MRGFSLLFLFVTLTTGFTHSLPRKSSIPSLTKTGSFPSRGTPHQSSLPLLGKLRGGADADDINALDKMMGCIQSKSTAIAALTASSLQSGPYGVVALWGIASAVVVPLTLYRQAFSFSVGYGFSVFAMAMALLSAFSPIVWSSSSALLTIAAAFYGFRLGSFLALRNIVNKAKGRELKSFDKTPRLKRIPFAAGVALFCKYKYSFLSLNSNSIIFSLSHSNLSRI